MDSHHFVVNIYHKVHYDIYVGRGRGSIWGNPFSHREGTLAQFKVVNLEESLQKYKDWMISQPGMVERAKKELRGKILGCFCRPPSGFRGIVRCHAQILAGIANDLLPENVD